MNSIFVACSLGPTLTAFAKVRSRCTSTSKIGIPNCQPSGQQEAVWLVEWCDGIRFPSKILEVSKPKGFPKNSFTRIFGIKSLKFAK